LVGVDDSLDCRWGSLTTLAQQRPPVGYIVAAIGLIIPIPGPQEFGRIISVGDWFRLEQ
jgi:hypothetical protein